MYQKITSIREFITHRIKEKVIYYYTPTEEHYLKSQYNSKECFTDTQILHIINEIEMGSYFIHKPTFIPIKNWSVLRVALNNNIPVYVKNRKEVYKVIDFESALKYNTFYYEEDEWK